MDDDYEAFREAFFHWCDSDWQEIYAAICEMSNHGLSVWRIRIQDAMSGGDMTTISRWFKIKTPAPMLQVNGQVISHPAEIGDHLKKSWEEVLCPNLPAEMAETDFNFFSEHVQHRQWQPPELAWEQLKGVAMNKKNSACGADGISVELLRKLPDEAWDAVDDYFAEY